MDKKPKKILKRGNVWATFMLSIGLIILSGPLYFDFSTPYLSGASFYTILLFSFAMYSLYRVVKYHKNEAEYLKMQGLFTDTNRNLVNTAEKEQPEPVSASKKTFSRGQEIRFEKESRVFDGVVQATQKSKNGLNIKVEYTDFRHFFDKTKVQKLTWIKEQQVL